jgi:hypothetical protein
MASPSNSIGAVVIDANIAVALAAHESGRDVAATAELVSYAAQDMHCAISSSGGHFHLQPMLQQ